MSLEKEIVPKRIAPIFKIGSRKVVRRIPEILRLCANKKVLHLGCADMPYTTQRGNDLLHSKILKVTDPSKLWGLDISIEGIKILQDMGFSNLIQGNVESAHDQISAERFDIVLAGEIIEHVANVGMFLEDLQTIMTEETELVLTTVNANTFKGFIHSLLRREKVHPDHNYYFSYRTLLQLLNKYDYTCKDIYYYQETRRRGLAGVMDKILAIPTYISPVLADGLIVRAKYEPK